MMARSPETLMHHRTSLLGAALLVAVAPPAAAQASSTADVVEQSAAPTAASLPLWEAGVVAITASQPAYPGAQQRVVKGVALPYLIYRGRMLRADQGGVGVRAIKTASVELDVGAAASFGSSPSDNDARRGMPRIGTLAELGPRVKLDLGAAPLGGRWRAAIPLRGVFDVSDGFAARGVAFEPDIGWSRRAASGWSVGAGVGALVGNAKLNETFYGVAPQYASAARPAYAARAGLIATRLSLNLGRPLGRDWRLFLSARAESVQGAANRASPLVDKRGGLTIGAGLTWTFARSDQPAYE
jgi:outer membrane protein